MSSKRSNLDWYKDWIAATEEVFGRKWIEKKARLLARGANVHPVVQAWQQAQEWLRSAQLTRKMECSPELVAFFDMGQNFHVTKGLSGFAQAFNSKRLKGPSWKDDCYVAHVASLALRSGYRASFVPTESDEGNRTPDLLIQRGAQTLFVECKKKSSYVRAGDAEAAWPSLQDRLEQLHVKVQHDCEVIVACIGGLDPDAVAAISTVAQSLVEQGKQGENVVPRYNALVLVKRSPPRPPGVEGAWIPAWQNPGGAHVTFSVDASGAPVYGPLFRSCLYILDAHNSNQILSSLRGARGQIPRDTSGMVFVAVDTDGIPEGDHGIYFSILSAWLRSELLRPDNVRVLAVVLTGGIARIDVTPDGAFHQTLSHWLVVRNPNTTEPFVVPGELPWLQSV